MALVETVIKILVLSYETGLATALVYCSKYRYFYDSIYYTYCSGYCSGYYGYQYCLYYYYTPELGLSDGTIIGIAFGSFVFLSIVCTICCSGIYACCTKSAGTRGRVIHSTNTQGGLAVVHSTTNIADNRLYTAPMLPPYPYYTPTNGAPSTQSSTVRPPSPPNYSSLYYDQAPPPAYEAQHGQRNDSNNLSPNAPQETTSSSHMGIRLSPIVRNNNT